MCKVPGDLYMVINQKQNAFHDIIQYFSSTLVCFADPGDGGRCVQVMWTGEVLLCNLTSSAALC